MRRGGLTVAAKPRFNKNEYFPKECVGTAKVRKEKRLKSRDTDNVCPSRELSRN